MNTCPNPILINTGKRMHINICTHVYNYLKGFEDLSPEARGKQLGAEGCLEWDLGEGCADADSPWSYPTAFEHL